MRSHHLADGAPRAAQLTEAFELGRSTSARLRHFYNRRVTSYARHARIPAAASSGDATTVIGTRFSRASEQIC
ncbi:hypothetical protein MycrhDRAFT_5528 [Mycolicibacterium rhodesiae JS60]|nr:hypothetical protein MycrhDRAFT_5528 [Mycolicibacterium rhodesiae JS60]